MFWSSVTKKSVVKWHTSPSSNVPMGPFLSYIICYLSPGHYISDFKLTTNYIYLIMWVLLRVFTTGGARGGAGKISLSSIPLRSRSTYIEGVFTVIQLIDRNNGSIQNITGCQSPVPCLVMAYARGAGGGRCSSLLWLTSEMQCNLNPVLFTKETLSSISVYLGFRLTMRCVFIANSSQPLTEIPNLWTAALVPSFSISLPLWNGTIANSGRIIKTSALKLSSLCNQRVNGRN